MLRLVVALTLAAALLSGCFGKDASRADMEEQAAEAIANFRADVVPGGRLAGINVPSSSYITVESEMNGFPVKAKPNVQGHMDLGPDGQVFLEARILAMRFTAYCDPQHIVTITENTEEYDIPEGSVESRNPIGYCTGPGSEELLLQAFEFELVDPAVFTGQLYTEEMTAIGFKDVGKKKVEAEYTLAGPEGSTTLFITAHGDKVVKIIADNAESHLVMEMEYGERGAIQKPAAERRVASPVTGEESVDDNGWHWRGITREGGPIGEYTLSIYDKDTQVSCSMSKTPIVSFDLGGPAVQTASQWQLVIREDGDRLLGAGDELTVTPPNSIVEGYDHRAVIHDTWAGSPALPGCAIPGPGIGLGALGLLAAFVVARRIA